MRGETAVKKANLISAMRDYNKKRTKRLERGVDFVVSSSENDQKILIRAITDPKSKSGHINVDAVRAMIDFLEKNNYDKGILIGKRFTTAAVREVKSANIELVTEDVGPTFRQERLYSTIGNFVENI